MTAAHRLVRLSPVLALTLLAGSPAAAVVLGGGSASGDCRVAFGGVDATAGASGVLCADGAPCDADGVADGTCRFAISVCTAVPVDGCAPATIDRIVVSGTALDVPPLPSGDDEACGPAVTVAVPVDTAAGATLLAWGDGELRDVDYLNLCCRSDAEPLAAARCALAVKPRIAGCTSAHVPAAARAEFERARRLVERAASDATRRTRIVHRAVVLLGKVRDRGRNLAPRDACGFSLALVASHALSVLGAE